MDPKVQTVVEYINTLLTPSSKRNYMNLIELREHLETNPEKYESISDVLRPILEEYIEAEKETIYADVEHELGDINEEFEYYLLDLSEAKKPAKKESKKESSKKGSKKPAKKKKSYKDDPDYEKPEYKRGSDVAPDEKYPGPYGGPARRFLSKGLIKRFKKDYGEDWRKVYYSVSRKVYDKWRGRGKTELPRSKWTRGKDNIYRAKHSSSGEEKSGRTKSGK